MNCYLVYGPPASGKTTLFQGLADDLGYVYISVGNLTRQEIVLGSAVGSELSYYLQRNTQYPVELIAKVVNNNILKLNKDVSGFILDGFPKYPEEVGEFLTFVNDNHITVEATIIVEVSFDEVLKRSRQRRICQNCLKQAEVGVSGDGCPYCGAQLTLRDDDEQKAIKNRYSDYESSISATLEALKNNCGRVIRIDGMASKSEALLNLRKELAL